jgi:hypothetical protein
MRVLGHLAALISVKEDVVNIERRGNKGLLVGNRAGLGSGSSSIKSVNSPETLTDRAKVKVNLDFVVLESNQRESKTRVSAEPEKKRDVKGGLRKGLARSAHLGRDTGGSARTSNVSERRVNHVGELGGVSNHLEITTLLLRGHCDLVPDVHPVTILTVNSLTTNLNLNLGDKLLTDEIEPAGIDTSRTSSGGNHGLVDFRKGNLKVCAVSKISVSGDGAGHTSAEIGLARESLFDGLHGEVGMASVRHLPESDLGGSSKEHILGAVGD